MPWSISSFSVRVKFSFFNKKEIEVPGKIFESDLIKIVDIIAPSSIEIGSNYLKLGERFAKNFFIFSYPRYLNTAWLSPIINSDIPMDISFFIHPAETGIILKQNLAGKSKSLLNGFAIFYFAVNLRNIKAYLVIKISLELKLIQL